MRVIIILPEEFMIVSKLFGLLSIVTLEVLIVMIVSGLDLRLL